MWMPPPDHVAVPIRIAEESCKWPNFDLIVAIPERHPRPGVIHHSDRGVQYASYDYVEQLKQIGAQISMSDVNNPYDNAKAESFFKTLKQEEVYLKEYRSFED